MWHSKTHMPPHTSHKCKLTTNLRCSRLQYFKVEISIICCKNALGYSLCCKLSQRWRCN
jgi:hypothetical protein